MIQVNDSDAAQPKRAWPVSILKWGAITLALGVVFAWFGVYDTGFVPLPERIVYWTGMMAIGVIASIVAGPLVFEKWMPGAHPAIQIVVVGAIISVPITIGLAVLEALDGTVAPPDWWALQYVYVIAISTLLTAGAWLIDRATAKQKIATAPPAIVASGTAFSDRLPVKFRAGMVYAVSAEDHYLRVHTSAGETMILMRLADAVRELAALEGLQTHRSWWVAKQGLADVTRDEGKVMLKLKSGVEAPVSRTYQKTVKDAGWL